MDAAHEKPQAGRTALDFNERSQLSDEQWFSFYGFGGSGPVDAETEAQFAALIERLELRAGKRLRQPGRGKCLRAFLANPDGFRRCSVEALSRGHRNAVGLLVRMVKDDEHEPPTMADGAS